METIEINIFHFFNHPILYPFMTHDIYEALENAWLHDKHTAKIPKKQFEFMIELYFESLKN